MVRKAGPTGQKSKVSYFILFIVCHKQRKHYLHTNFYTNLCLSNSGRKKVRNDEM